MSRELAAPASNGLPAKTKSKSFFVRVMMFTKYLEFIYIGKEKERKITFLRWSTNWAHCKLKLTIDWRSHLFKD